MVFAVDEGVEVFVGSLVVLELDEVAEELLFELALVLLEPPDDELPPEEVPPVEEPPPDEPPPVGGAAVIFMVASVAVRSQDIAP